MRRQVAPEKLDSLSPDAPEAIRSRRDLDLINSLMGNHQWITGILEKRLPGRVVEIGAGDGKLANALSGLGWKVTAVDLVPKPFSCASEVNWISGDVREVIADLEGDVLIGSLIWHHFPTPMLQEFGSLLERFHGFLASEPWRVMHARLLGCALLPFVNGVTRHDMFVSITAGFRRGELPEWFHLDTAHWEIEEAGTLFGAYRLQAWKRLG